MTAASSPRCASAFAHRLQNLLVPEVQPVKISDRQRRAPLIRRNAPPSLQWNGKRRTASEANLELKSIVGQGNVGIPGGYQPRDRFGMRQIVRDVREPGAARLQFANSASACSTV
jgi:hypothetical protein